MKHCNQIVLPNKSKCIEILLRIHSCNWEKVLVSCVYRAPHTNVDILSDLFLEILRNNINKTIYLHGDLNIAYFKYMQKDKLAVQILSKL